jgi:hypothetical protein
MVTMLSTCNSLSLPLSLYIIGGVTPYLSFDDVMYGRPQCINVITCYFLLTVTAVTCF